MLLQHTVVVGSLNPGKILAVREFVAQDARFSGRVLEVVGVAVESGVRPQPWSQREMAVGATRRARGVADTRESVVAIGIESGVFSFRDETGTTRMFDATCCAVLFHTGLLFPVAEIGFSPAWEVPADVALLMEEDALEMDEAFFRCGLTKDPHIGRTVGAIGLVSKGRATRGDYTKMALGAALLSWNGFADAL